MKSTLLLMICVAIPIAATAIPDEELKQEMMLKVSQQYSQCAAYYEIAASVLQTTGTAGARDALKMKRDSLTYAISMSTESQAEKSAEEISDKDYADAIEEMHDLAKIDTAKFNSLLSNYRQNCRKAINDPSSFIESALSGYRNDKTTSVKIPAPGRIPTDAIIRYGKPTTMVSNPQRCLPPDEIVTISLNTVLVEGDMICTAHTDGACDSERLWLSYPQYIEQLHPARPAQTFSKRSSVAYKNGEMEKNNEIVACLESVKPN